jgi:SapC
LEAKVQQTNTIPDDGQRATLPIFYSRPRPLDGVLDRDRSLQPVSDFRFARGTNSVLLGAAEFPRAMRSYPIVFTGREPRIAVAVLGVESNENLFVSADGKWRQGHYIPAYVRRYPFIFLEQPGKTELTLCIDEASGLLTQSADRPLFEGGEPTQLVRNALDFCREFHEQTLASAAFVAELARQQLLVPNEARIRLNSGKEMTLRDFLVIDEAKFNALPDEVFLDWRRRGWLPLIYAHLLSTASWSTLVELEANKQQQ